MSGLGDEVVTRCSSCGYALKARRYAVPFECPICRAPFNAEAPAPPRDPDPNLDADADVLDMSPSHTTDERSPGEITSASMHAATTSPLGSATRPLREPDVLDAQAHAGEARAAHARPTISYTPLDAGELWSEFGDAHAHPEPARAATHTEDETHAEDETRAEDETHAAAKPLQAEPRQSYTAAPAPRPGVTPQPATHAQQTSFPRSTTLGLAGTPSAATTPTPSASAAEFQPAPARVEPLSALRSPGAFEPDVAASALAHYAGAYGAARATITLGTSIKLLGVPFGLFAALGVYTAAESFWTWPRGGEAGLALALFFGAGTFTLFFVLGVIVVALGSLKKSAVDSAVGSSPFLTNEQRAEVMSLR
jgi:hypothetical protein